MAKARQRPPERHGDPYATEAQRPPRLDIQNRLKEGPTAVMKAVWADPDDVSPTHRYAREIRGWRTHCPLRAALRRHGSASSITERHIWAADKLRLLHDVARYGLTGSPFLELNTGGFGPSLGPGDNAVDRLYARSAFVKAMHGLGWLNTMMAEWVVIANRSTLSWTKAYLSTDKPNPAERALEMQRLVRLLDELEAHFASEIDDDLKRGRLLEVV